MTLSETIILGVVSGVLSSAAIYLTVKIFNALFVPWFQKVVYRGVNVAGTWYCLAFDMAQEIRGVAADRNRFADDGSLRGSIWLTLGVVCFIAYWVGITRYSTINTEKGRMFIIKDKNHDRVLAEFKERRKAQWRQWYATVNLGNDPAKEIGKFRWLKEQEAITDAELNEAIEQITLHHDLQPGGQAREAIGRRLN